jgi:hypothetical protein
VGKECFKYGLYLRGLTHDLSKLLPSEFFNYMNYFYDYDNKCKRYSKKVIENDFNMSWLIHQKRNDHHWQWWIIHMDDGSTEVMEMNIDALLEMISDWVGAGIAINGKENVINWYLDNKDKMLLNEHTRTALEFLLFDNYEKH